MLSSHIISWFTVFPGDIVVFLLSIVPMVERFAIPIGIGVYHLSWWRVYGIVVVGNVIPIVIVFYFLDISSRFLSAHSIIMKRWLDWWFARVEKEFASHYERYGLVALIILTAIPLPITGVWTAAVAAWLFRLPRVRATWYIMVGVVIASALITAATLGVINIGIRVW